MNNKDIKIIRGQIRQIILELLPEIVELEIYRNFEKKANTRIDTLEAYVKNMMADFDKRHKDIMGFIVRQTIGTGNNKNEK